jgi:multicomponent Na+:H+ antiporter subunit D
VALLFVATLVFAWGYYDEVHAHFHVLMLLFMTGMIGFCLTHDLFNLFVWFELMSVAAFALTGYALKTDALEGALNFTVTNTIGSYLILGGLGLIYIQVGALDFSALARGVAASQGSPVITASFALLASGLLIKGAQVPFHFWLSDAHAVAPSPVSVIFSGAMVSLGLYGVAVLVWTVFAASAPVQHLVHTLLLGMGAASAALGGVMALMQRHVKRLLAFSTISHAGILLVGVSLLDRNGLSGMLVYLIGHGLVKGALFMVAGIMLATLGGIDEIGLRGKGREIWPAGLVMAFAGLLLAGLPVGLMDTGIERIGLALRGGHEMVVRVAVVTGMVCTGAAVLRVAGRVFMGWGPVSGEEERSPTDDETEKADRPLWLMLLPTTVLVLLSLLGSHDADRIGWRAASQLMQPDQGAILGLAVAHPGVIPAWSRAPGSWLPWLATMLALGLALLELFWHRLPRPAARGYDRVLGPVLDGLRLVHSGLIGDYVTWIAVGLALFAATFALI